MAALCRGQRGYEIIPTLFGRLSRKVRKIRGDIMSNLKVTEKMRWRYGEFSGLGMSFSREKIYHPLQMGKIGDFDQ